MTRVISLIISLCFAVSVYGQWQQDLSSALAHPDIANAQVSISVRDVNSSILLDQGADILLIPASTTKTITTMSAIGMLGGDYSYATEVSYTGEIADDGTLYGDIIIKGSGDPSLGSSEDDQVDDIHTLISKIIAAIRGKGITCVNGYISLDDTAFDVEAVHPGWPWDDLCNYYAAGSGGINLNENRYTVTFERSEAAHQPTTISSASPLYPGLEIDNQVTTGELGSYDNAYLYGDPYGVQRILRGTIPPGKGTFQIEGAVPDGALYLGYLLSTGLDIAGIGVKGYKKVVLDQAVERASIMSITSPPLKELARYANRESDNLYCDVFLKTMGYKESGQGSWSSGQDAITTYLEGLQIDGKGWRQVDGSGLSARNRISPSFMTSFLHGQYKRIGLSDMKYLLPKAGKEGTVKNFLNGYDAQGAAWLKSGSISSVVAYAGILELSPGNPVFISIASNGHRVSNSAVRKQLEKLIDIIYVGLKSDMNKR